MRRKPINTRAEDADRAAIAAMEPGYAVQEGRFSGTVRTDESEELPAVDSYRDAAQSSNAPEPHRAVLHLDRELCHDHHRRR